MAHKGIVYVGLSGGVDSAVSALLLQKAGYEVVGVFIKVWTPDWMPCTWKSDRLDAMRVAAHLGIPFKTLDLEREYKAGVVDYMLSEYKAGRTPNPDVMCNKEVKFGAFYEWARKEGADFVATGHYARIIKHVAQSTEYKEKREEYQLHKAHDQGKEQSYFIWTLKKEQLPHILLPVGALQKSEVRRLAEKFKLPVATKKDSQGLCFIGKVDFKDFLKHFIEEKEGAVLDTSGTVVGTHRGAAFFTLGERHGFTIERKTPTDEPFYVVSKDVRHNTITVAHERPEGILPVKKVLLSSINILGSLEGELHAQVRYHGARVPVTVLEKESKLEVTFLEPVAVAAGQSVVLYRNTQLVAAGIVV